jgi:hypothetical protein
MDQDRGKGDRGARGVGSGLIGATVPKRPDSALWLATPIQRSLLDGEEKVGEGKMGKGRERNDGMEDEAEGDI